MSEEQKPILSLLLDRDRLRGQSRMIPEGKDVASITEAQAAQVIHEIELYCSAAKISRKKLGRDIGYSASTVSEVLGGKYNGDWKQVIKDLDDWLENEREAAKIPKTTTFTWTAVAREIQTIARLMLQTRKIGLVYGPDTSGIGKTMAMQALHAEIAGSVFVTCETIQANSTGILRAIARGIGIQDSRGNRALYERIVGILKGTPRMLLIDQVHKLCGAKSDKPLHMLTEIWEATRAPQLWAGTTDIKTYLEKGEEKGDEPLAQIRSRIAYARDLLKRTFPTNQGGRGEPLFTIADIRGVFGRNKIKVSEDGIKFLWKLSCIPHSGALRCCENILQIATIIAAAEEKKLIEMGALVGALHDSVTTADYTAIAGELEHQGIRLALTA